MPNTKTRRCGTSQAPRDCPPTWFAASSHSPGTGGKATTPQTNRPGALDRGRPASGSSSPQRCCDLLDCRGLGGADALPTLAVGGGDLVGEVEDEATVFITFLGGRLAFQQRHRVTKVRE